jgi:hypothetical protein
MDSNYYNVDLNDPDSAFLVGAKISTFGGPEDVKSGQDNGEFAFGGSSVDEQGQESKLNYAAVDPAWYKNGIKPGSTVNVINPKTGQHVPVTLVDKGPARWTGRGIDVAPHVLKELGAETDDDVHIDFKPAILGGPTSQPAQQQDDQGQEEDLTTAEGAKSYLSRATMPGQPMQASTQGGGQQVSPSPANVSGVRKLDDGGYDLGDGVIGYPNGILSIHSGNTMTQYIPDDNSPNGYKTHIQNVQPKANIYRDPTSGLTYDISRGIQNAKPIELQGDPSTVDMGKVKQGDWNSVPEDLRDVAKNIASYRYPKVTGFALRSPYFQNLFKIVSKVDPSFNYQQYDQRQKALNSFLGDGKAAQNITSFNTALRHAETALDSSEKLKDTLGDSDQISNYLKFKGKTIAGNPAATNYETDARVFVRELERAVTGAVPSVSGIEEEAQPLLGGLGHYPNHEQRKQSMAEMAKLLGGRLGELQNSYERDLGKKPDVSFLSPEAEHTLRRLGLKDIADKYGTQGGKRPYIDPEGNAGSVAPQPFPGADAPKDEEGYEGFRAPDGKVYAKMPDGTLKQVSE